MKPCLSVDFVGQTAADFQKLIQQRDRKKIMSVEPAERIVAANLRFDRA